MNKKTIIKILTSVACLVPLLVAAGQGVKAEASTQSTFISTYKSDVKKASSKYRLYGSVMMAQAGVESAWGQSQLTQQANNFFGIKGAYNGQSVSMPTFEYDENGQVENINANFKKYPTAYASFADNGNTLRNGTSWNPSYYSGTWKENAATYADAANFLTNRYATAPNYGAVLISVIQQYQLDKLIDGASSSSSSSSNSTSTSSSSSSSASVSSSTVNQNTTTAAHGATPKPLAKVKYYGGDSYQLVKLSNSFKKYYVYNHVKGANKNEKKYTFRQLNVTKPVWVYVDMRGVKQGSNTSWYRIRFYKNNKSKKFWVYSPVLSFPNTYYSSVNGKLTVNVDSKQKIYDHMYGTSYVAKAIKNVDALKRNSRYNVDKIGVKDNIKTGELWYRISFSGKKGWVKSTAVESYSSKVIYLKDKANKQLYNSRAVVYDHVPEKGVKVKKTTASKAGFSTKKTVKTNMVAYSLDMKTVWYRIANAKGNQYWISATYVS
ncbi:glucosaminidase domain-containing protein [Lentilactobacillus sp. Marseille-Q4993]|uniref:glycoside hydrolase family 73 protein n=1 Tax=Lentilactobacillus sp. Marseille-Q4993 TaxID=3039492 RepID=UPI0024BD24D8|nr:glucosaminidase domain-containing protein [Lentilactobacillus sp. Marseille-Q4993]